MEQAKGRASSTVGRPLRIPILRKSPICGAAENPFGARGFRRASPYLCCRRCRNTDRQAGSTPRASAGAPCHWCRSRRFRAPLLSRCACSRRAASLHLGQTRSNFVGPGLFPSLRSIRSGVISPMRLRSRFYTKRGRFRAPSFLFSSAPAVAPLLVHMQLRQLAVRTGHKLLELILKAGRASGLGGFRREAAPL